MSLSDKISNWFSNDSENYEEETDPSTESEVQENRKVMTLVNSQRTESKTEHKIMLFEPRVFSDVKAIGKHLLSGQPAIVNFERMDDQQAYRIVDFLSGIVFAEKGEIQRISEQIFLCTPHGYVVEGSLTNLSAGRFN